MITLALIGLCLLVFLWQVSLSGEPGTGTDDSPAAVVGGPSEQDDFAIEWGASPDAIGDAGRESAAAPWWLSPFTAFTVGADLLHLVVNLLLLLVFGRTLELQLGRARFLALLGLGIAASTGVQALVGPSEDRLVVGAGAALATALGAYAVLHPRAVVLCLSLIPLFGSVVEVPALLLMTSWLAIDLIPAVGPLVDPAILVGLGLEYAGYAAAAIAGAGLALALVRGRPAVGETLAPT